MNDPLRIGTRGSKLALYQANWVKDTIAERLGRACELVILKTQGDKDVSKPIAELNGTGVFVKELERALFANEVDLAVHSLKDLPTDIPEGLCVAAYPIRVSPHEALLVHPDAVAEGQTIPVTEGATIGTSSLRRMAQLKEHRPDLNVVSIRGNVPTRIDMARQRTVDAVMLAAAGIDRLEIDLNGVARFDLDEATLVPAPGQGALAIEIRTGEPELLELLGRLNDAAAQRTTEAERQLLHSLGAGCSVPLGARAVAHGEQLELRAVYEVDPGTPLRRVCVRGATPDETAALALRVLDPPLGERGPSLPDLSGKHVLIAREPKPSQHLVRAIEASGGRATCRPPNETVWATAGTITTADWILVASFRAVEGLQRLLGPQETLAERLGAMKVGAVGSASARALAEQGVAVELLPAKRTGAGLAEAFLAHVGDARPSVLLPVASNGRPELRDALTAAGCDVTVLDVYGSTPRAPATADELAVDALILASSSGARATLGGPPPPATCKLVAIGPTTAQTLEELGHTVAATAETPNTAGLLAALARALS